MQAESLLAALGRLYPATRLLTAPGGLAPFESDGLTAFRARPRAVVLPETSEEVVETVRLCHETRVPFVARGSGTSQADVNLTRELVEAGRHMKVVVHDHVIVGAQRQSSLRAMGLI